ncbi:MAG: sigma-70 family RNA polymerase sigma factor [Verrucomicrobiota bacterium]
MPAAYPSSSEEHTLFVQKLFVEHFAVVRGFVLALLPDFVRAEDVVQETFLTVTCKAAEFQPGTEFPKWACAIARYKVMEARRAEMRAGAGLSDEMLHTLAECPAAVRDETRIDLLKQCLDELAPQARRAMDLRYEEDLSPAQIAATCGWTAESAYSILSRARTFLKACIERRMQHES